MLIKYRIIKEPGLLVQHYSGTFSLDYYTDFVHKMLQNPDWKTTNKVLTDLRDLDPTGLQKYISVIARIRKDIVKKDFVNVFIIDKPKTTVFSHLYQKNLLKLYSYQYCSTVNHAIRILGLTGYEKQIEQTLNELK